MSLPTDCQHEKDISPHAGHPKYALLARCLTCKKLWGTVSGIDWQEVFFDENGKEIDPPKPETWRDRSPLL